MSRRGSRGERVSRRLLVAALPVLVLVLAGCGAGEAATSTAVTKADVSVDTDLSWAACGPVGSAEPETRPGGDFFSDSAPDGDLVPGEPVAAAVCASYMGGHVADGTDLELSGSSLDALVNALNHSPRYDGDATCTDQGGVSRRVVFRYGDGRLLPVLLSTDTCGWADNGAQIRYNLEPYLAHLAERLDRATD